MPMILLKALWAREFGYKFSDLQDEPADELIQGWQALVMWKKGLNGTGNGDS